MNDLISRQAAIDAYILHTMDYLVGGKPRRAFTEVLRELPSAQPERKKGKWIPHSETCREYIGTVLVRVDYDYWFCDACGYRVEKGQPMYKFCPNCGADMRGEL